MKGNVLIIEDVRELAELIALYLSKEGLEVKQAESAEDALTLLGDWKSDLIILDLNLPGMDGFEFLQTWRKNHDTPVMIVSARNADEDLIAGLGGGADEFVTKPFSPKVLSARVRALLRRVRAQQESGTVSHVFRFGAFTLDYDSCTLKKGDEKIALSAKEYEVLAFLCKQAGHPEGPERIYSELWENQYGDVTTIAVHIQRLRKKIEDDSTNPRYIETVHGMGYRINPDYIEENAL
jgi:two-component system response regulator RegX3